MEQIITLRRKASHTTGITERRLGRIVFSPQAAAQRADEFLLVRKSDPAVGANDAAGFAAILVEDGAEHLVPDGLGVPVLSGLSELATVSPNSIIAVSPNGFTHTLYRPESRFNAIFATGQCNSNCLMCSQPPADDDIPSLIDEHLRLLDLIPSPPESFGITGGEPTLLGDGLVRILDEIKQRFPSVALTMLTNGRTFSDPALVRKLAAVVPNDFLVAIPLYADTPSIHDWIVQAKGAFAETMAGLYNAARYRLRVEIRVVLHMQTIPRLVPLMDFIYRNLPFVSHVALMGLENMGYVKKNWDELWIDPLDYADELTEAVRRMHYREMQVSIYNLPLCVVPKPVRAFARQSISDYKNLYLEECDGCTLRAECAGLFASSKERHSRGIQRQ
ncbi:His-Xaa-Ser system radical SAM maturase HxsC [Thauera sp. ZXT1-4]|jgi:His-Xaa-Ser system radical SAM maturase HxsC|uniref:His-Xaa-Ser system radical SAM maturase HxsC n=1 Tax=Thauera sp. ZXT1-4 TaxID=3460294 RepID=UPI004040B8D3